MSLFDRRRQQEAAQVELLSRAVREHSGPVLLTSELLEAADRALLAVLEVSQLRSYRGHWQTLRRAWTVCHELHAVVLRNEDPDPEVR